MVIKTITPQHNADSDAELLELYFEGISTLKRKQLPYILFTVAAKDVIKQHMAFVRLRMIIVMVGTTLMMMMMMVMVLIMLRMILEIALLIVMLLKGSVVVRDI